MKETISRQFVEILGAAQVVLHGEKLTEACTDYFGHWCGNADALLFPTSSDQVAACLKICNQNSISVTVQGGKTGLVAASVPSQTDGGVILNLKGLKGIGELDVANRSVIVEAGVTIAELNTYLSSFNLRFPISIGSEGECQIGGMISTNAGGHGVFRYGMSRHQLLGIEAVLADGRVVSNLRALRKDNVGYDFAQLFCGAEGTLGVVTCAALKVTPQARQSVTALLSIADINTVIDLYTQLSFDLSDFLCAFELIPASARELVETFAQNTSLPEIQYADWYVLLQAETTSATLPLEQLVSEALTASLNNGDIQDALLAQNKSQQLQLWKFREDIVFMQRKRGPVLPHDLSVSVSKIPQLLELGRQAVSRICENVSFITFGHVGDGNLHFNVVHNGPNQSFKTVYGPPIEAALCEVVQLLEGSISAEHGIGRKKRDLVKFSRDDVVVDLMRSTRSCFDPGGTLNSDVLF